MIYLVTHGEYSDYAVKGAFDCPGKAAAFREYHNYAHVEEMELNPKTPPIPDGFLYRLSFTIKSGGHYLMRESNLFTPSDWVCTSFTYATSPIDIVCYYFARNMDHAHKIAGDKLATVKTGSTLITGTRYLKVPELNFDGTKTGLMRNAHFNFTWRLNGSKATLLYKEEAK